jgi:hypothetical protein
MTYYEDLKSYQYWSTGEISDILNIGWLGREQKFTTGIVPKSFVDKLEKILASNSSTKSQVIVNRMRGFFDCEICNARSDELKTQDAKHKIVLGNAELLIPHYLKNGYYFSAPTLIHHYIIVHSYLPPKEFIDSILALDLGTEFNGGEIFRNLVEKHGGMYFH